MATDHKYYKRNNFQSIAMEDYEVRDLFFRADCPELEIDVCECNCINRDKVRYEDYIFEFYIGVRNIGRKLCPNFKLALICKPKRFSRNFTLIANSPNINSFSNTLLDGGREKWTFESKETIFPSESLDFSVSFKIPYTHFKRFLDESDFEILLWYDGGPKTYKYNVKEDVFSSDKV